MSAGVCGKRVGFEEIFGSTSPTACSSAKRFRWSTGSPIQSDLGAGSEDSFSFLLHMFPSLDAELVETILRNHNNKIEDAIKALRTLSFDDANARNNVESFNPPTTSSSFPNENVATSNQMSQERIDEVKDMNPASDNENTNDSSKWVDMFVQEMMNATNLEDARIRAARILESFEQSIITHTRETEELRNASLKEHLQSLLSDNQIIKKAVAIQHERYTEQEEKSREIQQLKSMLGQYQEQIQSLELSNYSLKLHLQRAQGSSSMPGQFHPDLF